MPTYTYKAKVTGEIFEYRQSINDKPLQYWPVDVPGFDPDNPKEVERIISQNVNVIFNGKGFYQTDYKLKSENKPNGDKSSVSNKKK